MDLYIPRPYGEVLNYLYLFAPSVHVIRSESFQKNVQWIWSSPLAEIRTMRCVWVIAGP
jgi:hypothetical protein